MEYKDLNDYELLSYIAENNEDAHNLMIQKYYPLVSSICNKMSKYINNSGIDKSDLFQEGMLGLTTAITKFTEQKDVIFYTYAKMCIERRIISAIVAAKRQKHKILNESISYDTSDLTSVKFLKDKNQDPLEILTNISSVSDIEKKVKSKLTNFEEQVFELMLSGFKYKEIAEILDKDAKSVDNAIQRIRNKAKSIIEF